LVIPCNTRDKKKAAREAASLNFFLYVQRFVLVAGEGFEPPTSGL
jgi:hypothetical protein